MEPQIKSFEVKHKKVWFCHRAFREQLVLVLVMNKSPVMEPEVSSQFL
jgi:hypothetical protein